MTPALSLEVREELMRVFLASVGAVSLSGVLVALPIVGLLLWNRVDFDLLAVWAAGIVVAEGAVLLAELVRRKRAGGGTESPTRWERPYLCLMAIDGLAWGLCGWWFLPAEPGQALVVMMLVAMLSASAAVQMGPVPKLYVAFMTGLLLPMLVRLSTQGDMDHAVMAAGSLFTGLVMLSCALAIRRSMARTAAIAIENRTLAAELALRRAEAVEANLAKSRFFAAASHDLRQPVHAIGLFAELLRHEGLPAAQATVVRNLRRAVTSLDELVGSLLDLSRLDAGALTPDRGTIALAPMLAALQAEFAPQAHARGLEMRAVPCRLAVDSDPMLLERILRNLLSNAVRYTPSGRVLLGCRRRAAHVSIEVWDTGLGIAPEHQRRIFDEFHQVSNPNRDRSQGLGLGLSIVDRLARLLDATVEVQSVPGRGSRFAVQVPLSTAPVLLPSRAAPHPYADPLRGALVMLVDDDANVREAMASVLRAWGVHAVCADSYEDAMAGLRAIARTPDLILSDWRLPGGHDGIELIAALREEFAEAVPALLVTGDSTSIADMSDAEISVLHKPVDPERLRIAIAQCLRSRPTAERLPGLVAQQA